MHEVESAVDSAPAGQSLHDNSFPAPDLKLPKGHLTHTPRSALNKNPASHIKLVILHFEFEGHAIHSEEFNDGRNLPVGQSTQ